MCLIILYCLIISHALLLPSINFQKHSISVLKVVLALDGEIGGSHGVKFPLVVEGLSCGQRQSYFS